MQFTINVFPQPGGQPNFSVTVDAPDIQLALTAAIPEIVRMARASSEVITALLPAEPAPEAPASPK